MSVVMLMVVMIVMFMGMGVGGRWWKVVEVGERKRWYKVDDT